MTDTHRKRTHTLVSGIAGRDVAVARATHEHAHSEKGTADTGVSTRWFCARANGRVSKHFYRSETPFAQGERAADNPPTTGQCSCESVGSGNRKVKLSGTVTNVDMQLVAVTGSFLLF